MLSILHLRVTLAPNMSFEDGKGTVKSVSRKQKLNTKTAPKLSSSEKLTIYQL